jgi:hypothetical protein
VLKSWSAGCSVFTVEEAAAGRQTALHMQPRQQLLLLAIGSGGPQPLQWSLCGGPTINMAACFS